MYYKLLMARNLPKSFSCYQNNYDKKPTGRAFIFLRIGIKESNSFVGLLN